MDLRRTVIDAEGADVAEEAGDDRVVGDAEPAQDLHAAVDDAPDRLRADDLCHARFVRAALALVEHPGGVPDDEPALVDVHRVVGEHEAHPLVLAQGLAEGGAPPRIVCGDVVGALRGAEPACPVCVVRTISNDPRVGLLAALSISASVGASKRWGLRAGPRGVDKSSYGECAGAYGNSLALIVVRRFVRKIAQHVVEKIITIHLRGEVIPIKRRLYSSRAVASRHGVEPFEIRHPPRAEPGGGSSGL